MRREYGRLLRQYFAGQMKKLVPDFREVRVNSEYLWPGERAFCSSCSNHLNCWIVLSPSPKDYDEFTVMVGWSTLGRYPELGIIPSMIRPSHDRKEFDQEEYLVRLPQLWTDEDVWWVVKKFEIPVSLEQLQEWIAPISPEDARKLVVPAVDDAIRKILDFGIPYLSSFASSRIC